MMLLAVPLQGFAAASMTSCESILATENFTLHDNSVDQSAHHSHHHAAGHVQHDHAHHGSISHDGDGSHHGVAKCGVCAACCLGVTMSAPVIAALKFQPNVLESPQPIASFPHSAVPVSLERPPQILFV